MSVQNALINPKDAVMTKIPDSKAPLSFIGQKRNFIKAFRHIINANIIADVEGQAVIGGVVLDAQTQ